MASSKQALTTPSGRPASFGVRVRERINATAAVNQMNRCILGEEELTSAQVAMIRLALDKTCPTLRAVEVESNQQVRDVKTIPSNVFLEIIEGKAERIE